MELNAITFKFKKEKSEYKQAHYINGKAVLNNKVIAYLEGQLIDRKNKLSYDNFHSICDFFTAELQECGCYLCDAKGHLRAPAKDLVSEACNSGPFIYIESINVIEEARGQDVSLLMLKACLDHFQWTLAAIFPAPLTPFDGTVFREVVVKLSRHFARLGFIQCDESQFWILDRSAYNGVILQPNNSLVVLQKPEKMKLSDINKELVDVMHANDDKLEGLPFNLAISRIVSCLQRGASINESNLLHHVVANKKNNLIAISIALCGDINKQDEEGNTPLHVASSVTNIIGSTILLALGADATILDRKGLNHLQKAHEVLQIAERSKRDFALAFGIDIPDAQMMMMDGFFN